MAGLLDFLFGGGAPAGVLSMAPSTGILTGPMPTQAAPYAAMTPQPQQQGILGNLFGRLGSAIPAGTGQNIVDYFQNNPSTIAALAAGIGGAPNMRMGLAKAAGAIPEAKANDLAWSTQLATRKAGQQWLDANKGNLDPATIALLRADPQLLEGIVSAQLTPRPGVAVPAGSELRDPITGALRGPSSNPFAPQTGSDTGDTGAIGAPAGDQTASAPPSVADASSAVGGDTPTGAAPQAPTPPATKPGRNEAFLKSLPPDSQKLIQDFVDYKSNPADIYSTRQYMIPQAIAAAQKYDPSYDPSKFPIIQKVKTDYTSGSNGVSIQAANTLTGHLYLLKQFADALQNGQFPDANAANNWIKSHAGDPSISNFKTLVNGIQAEAAKVYSGSGMTESDRQAWGQVLNPDMSPDQINGAIDTAVHMMSSRLGSMAWQYKTITGQDAPIFSPQSRAIMQGMGIDPDAVVNGTLPTMSKSSVPNPTKPNKGDIARPPPGTSGPTYVFDGTQWVPQ